MGGRRGKRGADDRGEHKEVRRSAPRDARASRVDRLADKRGDPSRHEGGEGYVLLRQPCEVRGHAGDRGLRDGDQLLEGSLHKVRQAFKRRGGNEALHGDRGREGHDVRPRHGRLPRAGDKGVRRDALLQGVGDVRAGGGSVRRGCLWRGGGSVRRGGRCRWRFGEGRGWRDCR